MSQQSQPQILILLLDTPPEPLPLPRAPWPHHGQCNASAWLVEITPCHSVRAVQHNSPCLTWLSHKGGLNVCKCALPTCAQSLGPLRHTCFGGGQTMGLQSQCVCVCARVSIVDSPSLSLSLSLLSLLSSLAPSQFPTLCIFSLIPFLSIFLSNSPAHICRLSLCESPLSNSHSHLGFVGGRHRHGG